MIDFHTHPVLIREFVEKYPGYERAARQVFNIGNNFQPLETFFLQMDVAGVDRAALQPIDCRRARKNSVPVPLILVGPWPRAGDTWGPRRSRRAGTYR